MKNTNDVFNRMNNRYSGMSKGQKRLCAYLTDHVDTAAFLTAAKLGAKVGVSESTVVRFASELGYRGYPEFQKALESVLKDRLSNKEENKSRYDGAKGRGTLQSVIRADIERLNETLASVDEDVFETAISMITRARSIYVVGFRGCAPLASYLGYHLGYMFDDVRIISTGNASEVFERLLHMSKKDVIIGISFPKYSLLTVKALEYANVLSAGIITLSDSVHAPINLYSSCNLIAHSDLSSVVESMAAPMSVANAIIIGLSKKRSKEFIAANDLMENLFDEFGVPGRDDMEYLDDSVRFGLEEADNR